MVNDTYPSSTKALDQKEVTVDHRLQETKWVGISDSLNNTFSDVVGGYRFKSLLIIHNDARSTGYARENQATQILG